MQTQPRAKFVASLLTDLRAAPQFIDTLVPPLTDALLGQEALRAELAAQAAEACAEAVASIASEQGGPRKPPVKAPKARL